MKKFLKITLSLGLIRDDVTERIEASEEEESPGNAFYRPLIHSNIGQKSMAINTIKPEVYER